MVILFSHIKRTKLFLEFLFYSWHSWCCYCVSCDINLVGAAKSTFFNNCTGTFRVFITKMNNVIKTAIRFNGLRVLLNPVKNVASVSAGNQQRQLARSLWYMSNSRNGAVDQKIEHSHLCSCGCGGIKRATHTKCT